MGLDVLDVLGEHVLPVLLALGVVFLDPVVNEVWPANLDLGVEELREIPLVHAGALQVEVEEALGGRLDYPLLPMVGVLYLA